MKTQNKEVVKLGRPSRPISFPNRKFTVNQLFGIIQRSNSRIGKVQVNNRVRAALIMGEIKVIDKKVIPRGRPERVFLKVDPSEQKALSAKAKRAETIRLKNKQLVTV